MLSLLLSVFLTISFASEFHDLPCDARACVIPYDTEGVQNGKEICYENETRAKKIKEINWKNGKREGVAYCWKNDKLTYEATYKNDRLNGIFVHYDYDSNGDRAWLIEDDEETGLSFSSQNGKVTDFSYCIVNGTAEFKAVLTCPNKDYGRFNEAVETFKKEMLERDAKKASANAKLMNGPQESTFSNGKVRAKWANVNGQISGKYLSYYENGDLKGDCQYLDGKENGTCLSYDEQKRLDKKETWLKGKAVRIEEFYDNGQPSKLTETTEPLKTCVTEYYETGSKWTHHCQTHDLSWYNDSTYEGPYTIWEEGNVVSVSGTYLKGERTGTWEYFEEKLLRQQLFYEKGILLKTIDYIRKAPQSRTVREYFPDGSLKIEKQLEGLEGDKQKLI
jgi:antitoxin component YwqK of YwqJK toxin-antitoxin module